MTRPTSADRLSRILVLVPWVIQHPEEATVDAVCERFGIDRAQLVEDLNLLFLCGLPPFSPGDLIEADIEGDRVVIRMADYLARPLRLTRWEALALLASGRALAQVPGIEEAAALSTALDKLAAAIAPDEKAAADVLADRVAIELEPAPPAILDALRDAIDARQTIRMEYYSFGRDDVASREADPLLVFGARPWYLIADDHRSAERRTFRVDRIRSIEPTGATFERPAGFDPQREASAPLYHPSPGDQTIVLELAPAASWIAEVTPHERAQKLRGGAMRLTLRTGTTVWLERLVLQQNGDVRVIEPDALRDRVAALARRALERYA